MNFLNYHALEHILIKYTGYIFIQILLKLRHYQKNQIISRYIMPKIKGCNLLWDKRWNAQ